MSRTSLQDMLAVTDPLQKWNWDISFNRIPGFSDSRQLPIKATATSIPGTTIEAVQWEGHGIRLHFAGRRMYDETWEVTLIETRDNTTRDAMLAWKEMARSWVRNSGAYKSQYAVTADVTLYDDAGKAVKVINLVNVFPTAIGNVALDQSSGIIEYQVTFSLDLTVDVR